MPSTGWVILLDFIKSKWVETFCWRWYKVTENKYMQHTTQWLPFHCSVTWPLFTHLYSKLPTCFQHEVTTSQDHLSLESLWQTTALTDSLGSTGRSSASSGVSSLGWTRWALRVLSNCKDSMTLKFRCNFAGHVNQKNNVLLIVLFCYANTPGLFLNQRAFKLAVATGKKN